METTCRAAVYRAPAWGEESSLFPPVLAGKFRARSVLPEKLIKLERERGEE